MKEKYTDFAGYESLKEKLKSDPLVKLQEHFNAELKPSPEAIEAAEKIFSRKDGINKEDTAVIIQAAIDAATADLAKKFVDMKAYAEFLEIKYKHPHWDSESRPTKETEPVPTSENKRMKDETTRLRQIQAAQDYDEMYIKAFRDEAKRRKEAARQSEWRITEAGEPPDAGWYLHLGSGSEPLLFNAAQLEKLEAIVEAHNKISGVGSTRSGEAVEAESRKDHTEPCNTALPSKLREIAEKAAVEIHWHHVQKPDAYGQEEAARTASIIERELRKLLPCPKPQKFS